ncbi:MAG: YfhO family protein, partial [Chloroflexota bacterium]|nr:YfhO family protein [Chloroflexota bacterium]
REDAVAIAGGREPVFETEHVRVYENPNAFPHAWIVHETVVTTRDDAIDRLLLREIDLRTAALIETDDVTVQPLPTGASESATITRYDPERIELRATAAADGLLVLSEIHESGWRAYVNGDEVGIVPANVALRGIPLPAGEHTVVLEYDPPALRVGLALSLLSHALLIGALVAVVITIRRNGQPAR